MRGAVISGATGAIGRALVLELCKNGVPVLALLRSEARLENLPTHPLLTVKCCALSELNALEPDTGQKFDVFYHLAWAGTAGKARDDVTQQIANISYAADAVLAAKRLGCSRFIGVGSQAEYGRVAGALTPETPAFPETAYGSAKLAAGKLTGLLAAQLSLSHVWVRVLSVYGPADGEGSLISTAIRSMLQGKAPRLTAATQIWDYLYAADAASALYLLGLGTVTGKVYVLGSGKARMLREYLEELRDVVAPGLPLRFGEVAFSPKQVMHLEADINALTRDTGWRPRISFSDGICETAAWWQAKQRECGR